MDSKNVLYENLGSNNFDFLSSNGVKSMTTTYATGASDTGYYSGSECTINYQTIQANSDMFGVETNPIESTPSTARYIKDNGSQCRSAEPLCHVKLGSLIELKQRTKKLLCFLEETQKKRPPKYSMTRTYGPYQTPALIKPTPVYNYLPLPTSCIFDPDDINVDPELETRTLSLETLFEEEGKDNCSIYNRLTRKCYCLNQLEYNDFMIQFNDSKYYTSTIGEIIKNLRIIKKFLYMGGYYTKHALMFLNEGLSESTEKEKQDITAGCAHADICNVFDDSSIVTVCISWPCKYVNYGDITTQALTASFLYKLAQIEEGQKYLKFSSRLTNDLKNVLRKNNENLEQDTIESLHATLNILHPSLVLGTKVSHYFRRNVSDKTKKSAEYQSPYSYKKQRHITVQTNCKEAETNFTIKRPKIIPTYTD